MAWFSNKAATIAASHTALTAFSWSLGHGFALPWLLDCGFSPAQALASISALLILRFGFRLFVPAAVSMLGPGGCMVSGIVVRALGFWTLSGAAEPSSFAAWILFSAASDALYWPCYHAWFAEIGTEGARGRELAIREAARILAEVGGPAAGALLVSGWGTDALFSAAAFSTLISVLPLLFARPSRPEIRIGALETMPLRKEGRSSEENRSAAAFAGDGWFAAGWVFCWELVLFQAAGGSLVLFGGASAASAAASALAALAAGHRVDKTGGAGVFRLAIAIAAVGLFARSLPVAAVLPAAAAGGALIGAALGPFYMTSVMSAIYAAGKRTGAPLLFHLRLEGAWDVGCGGACLAVAALCAAGLPIGLAGAFSFGGLAIVSRTLAPSFLRGN